MKKYVYLVIFLLGFANTSFAEKGINMGLSLQAGVFETSALEKEDDETSASKSAEGLFAIGSIFVEKVLPNEKFSYYIKHRKSRHDKVLEAVRNGLSSLDEITTKAYDDTPDAHPGLAKDQTLAHLLSHEKQGRLSNDDSRWYASID